MYVSEVGTPPTGRRPPPPTGNPGSATGHSAIVKDRASDIEAILKSDQNVTLLQGKFSYKEEPKLLSGTRNDSRPSFELTRPLFLAVAFHAHKTIAVLYQYGSDIMVTDVNGKYLMTLL